MSETITIAGLQFKVNPPYTEGHRLNENEAATLNQTWNENIRNNFASKVKEGKEAGLDHDTLQAQLDEYASTYKFGVRTGGGRVSDPVEAEALNIARNTVKEALRRKGKSLQDYTASAITDAAKRYLDGPNGERVREEAKRVVDARMAAAEEALDDIDLPEADAEEEEAA